MLSLSVQMPQLQLLLFIFLRVGAIFMFLPIFNSRAIPVLFKMGFAMSVALVLHPLLAGQARPLFTTIPEFAVAAACELMIGILIGLAVRTLFTGFQMAGQMAGYQMGMAIANVMDPATSAQVPILATFYNLIAILVFLSINAHIFLLRAIVESFQLVPLFDFEFNPAVMQHVISLAGNMFIIALKIGAPVIVALLLTSVALGLVARTIPQMNIFIVAMPLKIAIGLIFLGLSLPYMGEFLTGTFDAIGRSVLVLMTAMGT
ncbi:MAG: flagellar biosynthetic protein FliR [Desulfobacterales bacterium]|nr:flagellar biosynthetic protein FliR [Desulfobacterales bacterium]